MRLKTLACGVLLLAVTGPAVRAGSAVQRLPLAPQSKAHFQCGPTTLAAVLGFHGDPLPEAAITVAIYSPTARGVLLTDLAGFARGRGFLTLVRTGTLADLERAVAGRQPPIVLLDLGRGGIRLPHFTAITGWSESGVRHQDRRAGGKFVSRKTFIRQWERAGNQYLLITPSS